MPGDMVLESKEFLNSLVLGRDSELLFNQAQHKPVTVGSKFYRHHALNLDYRK